MAKLKTLRRNWTHQAKKADALIREVSEFLAQPQLQKSVADDYRIALKDKLGVIEHLAMELSPLLDSDDEAQDQFCEESNTLADTIRDAMRKLYLKSAQELASNPDSTTSFVDFITQTHTTHPLLNAQATNPPLNAQANDPPTSAQASFLLSFLTGVNEAGETSKARSIS